METPVSFKPVSGSTSKSRPTPAEISSRSDRAHGPRHFKTSASISRESAVAVACRRHQGARDRSTALQRADSKSSRTFFLSTVQPAPKTNKKTQQKMLCRRGPGENCPGPGNERERAARCHSLPAPPFSMASMARPRGEKRIIPFLPFACLKRTTHL